ncbi:hypothetical protein U1Q18_014580 [Sarracenia purpurea var. burkii]
MEAVIGWMAWYRGFPTPTEINKGDNSGSQAFSDLGDGNLGLKEKSEKKVSTSDVAEKSEVKGNSANAEVGLKGVTGVIEVSSVLFPDLNCDGYAVVKENSLLAGEVTQAVAIKEPICQALQVLEKMHVPRSADQGVGVDAIEPGESYQRVGEVPAHPVGSFFDAAREASALVLCGNQVQPSPKNVKEELRTEHMED